MTATITTRETVNWQTLLQIARLLPADNQLPLVSFTNPDAAAQFMRQQDPPGRKLCLLTKDTSLFWIVPVGVAELLLKNGFQQIMDTIYL